MSSEAPTKSEDALSRMWDRCIADTIVKTAAGLAIGVVASAVLFKRKPWPVIFGTGTGFGHGVANCQNDYRRVTVPKNLTNTAATQTSKEEAS